MSFVRQQPEPDTVRTQTATDAVKPASEASQSDAAVTIAYGAAEETVSGRESCVKWRTNSPQTLHAVQTGPPGRVLGRILGNEV